METKNHKDSDFMEFKRELRKLKIEGSDLKPKRKGRGILEELMRAKKRAFGSRRNQVAYRDS